jgi:hypothetical protein
MHRAPGRRWPFDHPGFARPGSSGRSMHKHRPPNLWGMLSTNPCHETCRVAPIGVGTVALSCSGSRRRWS